MNWLTCSLPALPFGSQIFAFVVTLCYGCSLMMGFRRWQLHWGKPPPTTFLVVFFVSNLILMYNWKKKNASTASKTALTVCRKCVCFIIIRNLRRSQVSRQWYLFWCSLRYSKDWFQVNLVCYWRYFNIRAKQQRLMLSIYHPMNPVLVGTTFFLLLFGVLKARRVIFARKLCLWQLWVFFSHFLIFQTLLHFLCHILIAGPVSHF